MAVANAARALAQAGNRRRTEWTLDIIPSSEPVMARCLVRFEAAAGGAAAFA
jgi:hypothetical protein